MVKKVHLVNFSDILQVARKTGYCWNAAHDILVNDEIPPMYECHQREFELSDFDATKNPYGYSTDTLKIMQAFCAAHKLKSFVLVND